MLLTEFNQEAFAKVMQNERIEEKIKIALTIDTLQNQWKQALGLTKTAPVKIIPALPCRLPQGLAIW